MGLPTTAEEITPAWFSQILKGVLVRPGTFKITPNVQEGIGFMSIMARVEFEAEEPVDNGPNYRKKYSLIVKLIPDDNSFIEGIRDLVREERFDQIEIKAYESFLPDLLRVVPELQKYVCPVHFAGIQEEDLTAKVPYTSVLVLEDLKPQGYTTRLYNQPFPESDFGQGIEFLALLHSGSKLVEQKRGRTLPEIYPWIPKWFGPERTEIPVMFSWLPVGFSIVIQFLDDLGDPSKLGMIKNFKRLELKAVEIFQAILEMGLRHPCGTHTDLWSHNILVNSDPTKCIQVIDWQLLTYVDPMFDLALYVLTTLSEGSMNPAGVNKALRSYVGKYHEACKDKGLPIDRSFEEFQEAFNTLGLGYAWLWYVMSFKAILNVEGSGPKALRVLELFDTLKVTDFLLSIV